MLEQINSPQDVKKLTQKQKKQLAEEFKRKRNISTRNKKIYIRCSFRKWRTSSIKFRSGRANNSTTLRI